MRQEWECMQNNVAILHFIGECTKSESVRWKLLYLNYKNDYG